MGATRKTWSSIKKMIKSDLFFLIRVYYYQFKAGTAS